MTVFRRLALATVSLVFLAVTASTARAQILSVYGTFAPIRISNIETGTTSTAGLNPTPTYGSYWAYGVSGGATYSPVHLGPLSLGIDARAATARQNKGADVILAGVRAAVKLPVLPFRPYVEAAGGYVASRSVITNPEAGISAGAVAKTPF